MGIEHDAQRPHLTPVDRPIVLPDRGSLRSPAHLHWGAPLPAADSGALAEFPPGATGSSASFDVAGGDEITPYGGRELRTPSIMAEFANGNRSLDLTVTDSSYDGNQLDITLTDAGYPL